MTAQTTTNTNTQPADRSALQLVAHYWALTKPRVTQLAIFVPSLAVFLSTSELPPGACRDSHTRIWLLAARHSRPFTDRKHIDGKMARTRMRPLPRWRLSPWQAIVFSGLEALSVCGCSAIS